MNSPCETTQDALVHNPNRATTSQKCMQHLSECEVCSAFSTSLHDVENFLHDTSEDMPESVAESILHRVHVDHSSHSAEKAADTGESPSPVPMLGAWLSAFTRRAIWAPVFAGTSIALLLATGTVLYVAPSPQPVVRDFSSDDASTLSVASLESSDSLELFESVELDERTPSPREVAGGEGYGQFAENPYRAVRRHPLSTFSIDVDTASYSNLRRFIENGALPPKDAVRIEELINYFPYADAPPTGRHPFAVHTEVAAAPWNSKHKLVRIALKGREVSASNRPQINLVFLVDVSGSMQDPNKLPLLKAAFALLVEQMRPQDQVAIVVYAGAAGVVLPPTRGTQSAEILRALDSLEAGGSTNGGAGIQKAYDLASANFVAGGVNRVIIATDGDFNVGRTSHGDLVSFIKSRATTGVFLTVLGFGMGNYQDETLEKLADHGNGNYAYIDNLREARKTLVEQISGTLVTIAKDVKIQVEFNPREVARYRLLGYENRLLANEDFADDTKDAGEIGAGHTVTAFYEVVPRGVQPSANETRELKYAQDEAPGSNTGVSRELLTVNLRYKRPRGHKSKRLEKVVANITPAFGKASTDFRFGAAVALFGMGVRQSPHRGIKDISRLFARTEDIAAGALGPDKAMHRHEFLTILRRARALHAPTMRSREDAHEDANEDANEDGFDERAVIMRPVGETHEGDRKLSREVTFVVMQSDITRLPSCREFRGDAGVRGRVQVEWDILPSGRVAHSRVVSTTVHNAAFESCLLREIGALRFEGYVSAPISVQFPLVFGGE